MRRSLGVVGLLVAAWLVLALPVLRPGEDGDTWLLVAGLGWLCAALRFRPLLLLRADMGDMEPTLLAWAGVLGVSGLGYALGAARTAQLVGIARGSITGRGAPAGHRWAAR